MLPTNPPISGTFRELSAKDFLSNKSLFLFFALRQLPNLSAKACPSPPRVLENVFSPPHPHLSNSP